MKTSGVLRMLVLAAAAVAMTSTSALTIKHGGAMPVRHLAEPAESESWDSADPTEAATTHPPHHTVAPVTTAAAAATATTAAPHHHHHNETTAPAVATTAAPAHATTAAVATTTAAPAHKEAAKSTTDVKDKKVGGKKNEGVIDGSSEGSAEIDKIDSRNVEKWTSVYDNPPLLVIKASLYAFIAYNDSTVCDSFNMTLNAVEQKDDGNSTHSFHVVAYINCTRNKIDETQGKFVLNFIPEGRRLLLTECGHREVGEIVNWLMIKDEVPQCMTPDQRRSFLAQPMKHIHAGNGTELAVAPVQTDFLTRLEELDGKEVAIAGSATVAMIALVVVLVVFVLRKRKAQKDLERTIAGAKAEHAVEDEGVEVPGKERKGLMDSAKAKASDIEEGSFVNSPAVKV